MSAYPPKADVNRCGAESPLMTQPGHSTGPSTNGRNRPFSVIREGRRQCRLLDRKAVVQLPRSDRRLSAYVEEGLPARLLAGALGAVERAGLVLGDHLVAGHGGAHLQPGGTQQRPGLPSRARQS